MTCSPMAVVYNLHGCGVGISSVLTGHGSTPQVGGGGGGGGGSLPFTGFDLRLVLLAGLALVLTGFMLRRAAYPTGDEYGRFLRGTHDEPIAGVAEYVRCYTVPGSFDRRTPAEIREAEEAEAESWPYLSGL